MSRILALASLTSGGFEELFDVEGLEEAAEEVERRFAADCLA